MLEGDFLPVNCRYNCGRVVNIDFIELDSCRDICTENVYNIILLSKGSLSLRINNQPTLCVAPCTLIFKENMHIEFVSSRMLSAQSIRFDVSFLNRNITFKMVNSGEYERRMEDFAYLPLNMFFENRDSFLHMLPLSKEEYKQIEELFFKFNIAIKDQTDDRWSCRARMHLNGILELLHQVYTDFCNPNTAPLFDKKDPNVWVALILKKIHTSYAQSISLVTLSDYIHINKTTVSKRFKEITGFSVTDYIIDCRIKCAAHSLATTHIRIGEIAKECGFSSEAYFVKQFRKRMCVTPAVYRNNKVEFRKSEFNATTQNI